MYLCMEYNCVQLLLDKANCWYAFAAQLCTEQSSEEYWHFQYETERQNAVVWKSV